MGSSKPELGLLMEPDLTRAGCDCDGGNRDSLPCERYPGPTDLRGWRAAAFCGCVELRVLCLLLRLAVVDARAGGGMPESVLIDD